MLISYFVPSLVLCYLSGLSHITLSCGPPLAVISFRKPSFMPQAQSHMALQCTCPSANINSELLESQ